MTIRWVAEVPGVQQNKRKKIKKRKSRQRFQKEMNQLRERPGQWANVVNYQSRFTATNAATTLRNNGFQAAVRKSHNGWYRVFARFTEN